MEEHWEKEVGLLHAKRPGVQGRGSGEDVGEGLERDVEMVVIEKRVGVLKVVRKVEGVVVSEDVGRVDVMSVVISEVGVVELAPVTEEE